MNGGRFFAFLVCLFGAAATFLPWAVDRLMGHEESGLRLCFGAASLLGFVGVMAAIYATRRSASSTRGRVLTGTLAGGVLIVDVVFALLADSVWRAVATNDYTLFDDEHGRPSIGWYVSVASAVVLAGCAMVPRLWRPAR